MRPSRAALLAGVALMILLAGCSGGPVSEQSTCLQPNVTTGYDPNLRRENVYTVPQRKPMPSWWQPQLGIIQRSIPILDAATDAVSRAGHEIWITGYATESGDSIVRYDTKTQEIDEYAVFDHNGEPFSGVDLLVTAEGTLWALMLKSGPESKHLALTKYDASENQFQLVDDKNGLLDPEVSLLDFVPRAPQSLLAETPDGRLVIGRDGVIDIYNPATNQAAEVLGRNSGLVVTSLAVSKEGYIWFVTKNDTSVRELDPTGGTIFDYGPPPDIDAENPEDQWAWMGQPLVIDNGGRIWFSDFGYLERFDGAEGYRWHSITRSDLFISIYDPEYLFKWERPHRTYQFANRDIWLVGSLTTVRYDPVTDGWCWIAPSSGPLAEDEDGHLWLVDRQIYRYEYKLHQ